MTDWLLRSGDCENFTNSSRHRIWGINSNRNNIFFLKNVKLGDRLWFVQSGSQGKLIAVATYRSHNSREIGPLIDISLTNEELGWTGSGTYDVEVHYTDLYWLTNCNNLLTHIKGPVTIRIYNEKCRVNLPQEYAHIVNYSKVTFE